MIATKKPVAVVDAAFLDVRGAAAFTTLSPSLIRRLIREGAIPTHRIARRILIARDELDAYIRSGGKAQTTSPPAA
jgi:excisionase family DNA binding protein